MSKEFNCPSCTEKILFAGGESIFQTCKACNAPVIVPSEFIYKDTEVLASEGFASLINDKPVDVDQVTNELTPGDSPPKSGDIIDPEARIEKFEVYQEKIGTHSIETKKVVDEIVAPKASTDFKTTSPFANDDGSISLEVSDVVSVSTQEELKANTQQKNLQSQTSLNSIHPVIERVKTEIQKGNKIKAVKIFRSMFNTSLQEAKTQVELIQRGENVDISQYLGQKGK